MHPAPTPISFEFDVLARTLLQILLQTKNPRRRTDSKRRGYPADKVVDPLQRVVDPKLLAASNGKGPTARRTVPAQKAPKAKVNEQTIIFAHVLGVSMLSLCAHIHSVQKPPGSLPLPLAFEPAGGEIL